MIRDKKTRMKQGTILRSMRGDMSLEGAAEVISANEKTIRNAEVGDSSLNIECVASLVKAYNASVEQVVMLLGLDNLFADSEASEHQRMLLESFEGMRYNCYYASGKEDSLEVLETQTLVSTEGHLETTAEARKHTYRCKVTCAAIATYAFLTFASDTKLSDRALMILPYERKLETKFNAGIGAILSLAFPSGSDMGQFPCFQLMAIVSDEYVNTIGDDNVRNLCIEYLRLPDADGGLRISIPDIQERSKGLFHELSMRLHGDVGNIDSFHP